MRTADDTDELDRLLAAVAQQDTLAFKRLYDLISVRLYRIARAIVRDHDRAEDAVQECLVRIWARSASFDPGHGAPMAWMARICRNTAVDELRRSPRPVNEMLQDTVDAVPPPRLEHEMVRRCLGGMDADRAAALVAVYWEGLSHAELADRLDLPLGTVKSRIRRSLLAIRRQMQ